MFACIFIQICKNRQSSFFEISESLLQKEVQRTNRFVSRKLTEFYEIHTLVFIKIVGNRAKNHKRHVKTTAYVTDRRALHLTGNRAKAVVKPETFCAVGDKHVSAGDNTLRHARVGQRFANRRQLCCRRLVTFKIYSPAMAGEVHLSLPVSELRDVHIMLHRLAANHQIADAHNR